MFQFTKSFLVKAALIGSAFLASCTAGGTSNNNSSDSNGDGTEQSSSSGVGVSGVVSKYGSITACGANLCGSKTGSTPVQLRGTSMGWSNSGWISDTFYNLKTVTAMANIWKADVVRAALGVCDKEGGGSAGCTVPGYLVDKEDNVDRIKTVVTAAIENDIYVIIDWHTHIARTTDANRFFSDIITWLKENNGGSVPPNVIFEVYNEPINDSWAQIKTHAESVIGTIRTAGADNLVLVGTNWWSRRPDQAAANPLTDPNVAYVLHFYAANMPLTGNNTEQVVTNNSPTFQSIIQSTMNAGKPVFVSEFGTVSGSGGGTHNEANSNVWLNFLDQNKISWVAWQLSYKEEASSFFVKSFRSQPATDADWANPAKMNASGKYIFNRLTTTN